MIISSVVLSHHRTYGSVYGGSLHFNVSLNMPLIFRHNLIVVNMH